MFLTLEIAFPTGCLLDHPSEPQSKCITPYSASNQLFLIFKIVNRFRHFSYPTKQQSITVHWEFKGFVSSRKLKGSRGTNVCLALTHVPTEPSCWQFCAQTLWKTSGQLPESSNRPLYLTQPVAWLSWDPNTTVWRSQTDPLSSHRKSN